MATHRFSIVIPTRERARTLAFTLRTCLVQEHPDFEVIVSDNHSSPATRAVVDAAADKRVKYVRTPRPLAMTDSLEFAASHATGEYILMLGDDDGLLPHALPAIDHILRKAPIKVLRWESAVYDWPDIAPQKRALPDRLLLPLKLIKHNHVVRPVASAPVIRAAANFEVEYTRLPVIYCSAIHHSLFEELRRKTGRVFRSESADVYSGFAFARLAETYYSVTAPMNVCGLSGNSTGVACLHQGGRSAIASEFRKLNAEAGHVFHRQIPFVSCLPASVADSFQHARDALFPDDASLAIDRRRLIGNCLRSLQLKEPADWQRFLDACRQALSDDDTLRTWFEAEYGRRPFRPVEAAANQETLRRHGGDYLYLDTRDFDVKDVFAAAQLCERLLGYRLDGLNPRHERATEEEAVTPLSELQEKEEIIQGLLVGIKERDKSIQIFTRMVEDRDRFIAHLEKQARELEAWRARWKRPLRRGLPHLLRKVVDRLIGSRPEKPAA